MIRVGVGYDSHRFDASRPLVLGGVEIPGVPGLAGHSDGDAIAHAITDALLGALGQGDIGTHFPPDEAQWRDADSIGLLERVVADARAAGWAVGNVDVTVVTESPRITPHASRMRHRLGPALGVAADAVSVKGKSNEGMGWIGRGEGLAVIAVAIMLGGERDGGSRP